MRTMVRSVTAVLGIATLAACGDATGSDRLEPDEIAGQYSVCTLTFRPEQSALPSVDIRGAAFELGRPQNLPFLAVDIEPQTFELNYTPKGQFTDRELRGMYTIRGDRVTFDFQSGVTPSGLLLPDPLLLDFQASPMTLATEATAFFDVPRADYARLAGISESGLAERIRGQLTARFGNPTCG